jgi:hypothetical protein
VSSFRTFRLLTDTTSVSIESQIDIDPIVNLSHLALDYPCLSDLLEGIGPRAFFPWIRLLTDETSVSTGSHVDIDPAVEHRSQSHPRR